MIRIDGSYGEGGGQILRTSFSLSAILGREMEIENIRAGRRKPGLMPQHLTGVRAIAEIVGGKLEGAELGSQRINLHPGEIRGGDYEFDVAKVKASAGSTGMVFQSIAPVLAFAERRSGLVLKGGTHTQWSPPIDYLRDVFLPTVARMGLDAYISTVKWGWYPQGGGVVEAGVRPTPSLKSIHLTERGDLIGITGTSVVSNLPLSIAERQRDRVLRRLEKEDLEAEINLFEAPSIGKGTFIFILARFENVVAGFSSLGRRGVRAETVADEAVDEFLPYYRSQAAVEAHLTDQIALYMALAEGRSSFTTSKVSQHLLTNIWVLEQFLPVRFDVRGNSGEEGEVTVEGIGYSKLFS